MLKHRLSKIGKTASVALCSLLVGGLLVSCEDMLDDYAYDDGDEPEWLGSSVYDFLIDNNSGHTYNNFAKLVEVLGEKETLSKTGSNTAFIADDEAFERFFNSDNAWGVHSIEEMSDAQLKTLYYGSVIPDAMLLDMLSASSAAESDEGTVLRRTTSVIAVDSISLVTSLNRPAYNKYWDALRGKNEQDTLHVVMDGTDPMMVHFLPDYLKNYGITEDDINFLFIKNGVQTKTYKSGEVFIYDKKVVASDVPLDEFSDDTMTITCKNGYLYRLDDVLVPPSNMAAEIRKREDTQIFSHILDRFCLPVYDASLTSEYLSITGKNDSIFRLRYYTKTNGGGIQPSDEVLDAADRPQSEDDVLLYDPGWNQYYATNSSAKVDMAAMLVPNDEAMYHYFTVGAGSLIMKEWNREDAANYVEITDYETLKLALNNVSDNLIASLINNLMQTSFKSTVPSRFDKITDDGNDEISGIREAVTECVIANNGVVYIINEVFGPTAYSAVSAPATILENMLIMRNIISQLGYNSFLLAKEATYSLFLPDDAGFVYYDPVSLIAYREGVSTAKPKVYQFFYDRNHPNATSTTKLMYAKIYEYDPDTYQIDPESEDYTPISQAFNYSSVTSYFGTGGSVSASSSLTLKQFLYNRMSDLIDNLIIVDSVMSGKKYYKTKAGGAVLVDNSSGTPVFQGGEQVENGHHVTVSVYYPDQLNGSAYTTIPLEENTDTEIFEGLPTPSTKSLYRQLIANATDADGEPDEEAPFYEFMNLAVPGFEEIEDFETLLSTIFPEAKSSAIKKDTMKTYSVFYTAKNDNGASTGTSINSVPFFNGYNYTVYVPTNEAIREIVEAGLPDWSDIQSCVSAGNIGQAASAMRLLKNFIRYHFQDNSIFYDNEDYDNEYETQLISNRGTYLTVTARKSGNSMTITDERGNVASVLADPENENITWNVLCRDIEFKANNKIPCLINTTAFSVAHQIDAVLTFDELYGYDGKIKRYARNGELVDVMTIDGEEYLIGRVDDNCGYLMKTRTSGQTKLSKEDYIYDNRGELILITSEGYRVQYDSKGNLDYVYEDEDCTIITKYSKNGEVIASVSISTGEEDNADVQE